MYSARTLLPLLALATLALAPLACGGSEDDGSSTAAESTDSSQAAPGDGTTTAGDGSGGSDPAAPPAAPPPAPPASPDGGGDGGGDAAAPGGGKALGETCAKDADCASNVCYVGGKGSYCSLACTPKNAKTVCAPPVFDGSCNKQGYCRKP
jgi:hypothetical protein